MLGCSEKRGTKKKLIRNITEQSRIELGRLSRWSDKKNPTTVCFQGVPGAFGTAKYAREQWKSLGKLKQQQSYCRVLWETIWELRMLLRNTEKRAGAVDTAMAKEKRTKKDGEEQNSLRAVLG